MNLHCTAAFGLALSLVVAPAAAQQVPSVQSKAVDGPVAAAPPGTQAQSAPGMVPAPQQLSAADEAAATALGHKLRCPVCQGMPIAESPATMAVDMMHRVRQMQAQGRSEDEILGYFTSRYGAWVLLDPPREGFALWVWVLPPLFMLVLAAGAVRMLRRLHERGARADGAQPHPAPEPPADSLLAAVRAEVDR